MPVSGSKWTALQHQSGMKLCTGRGHRLFIHWSQMLNYSKLSLTTSVKSVVLMKSFFLRGPHSWWYLIFPRWSEFVLFAWFQIPYWTNFLVLRSASDPRYDSHRFERISNIIKQFKLSCMKTQSQQFQGMEVKNSQFTALIDLFTGNTYIMLVNTGDAAKIPTTLTQLNISAAKKHFEKFIPENAWIKSCNVNEKLTV